MSQSLPRLGWEAGERWADWRVPEASLFRGYAQGVPQRPQEPSASAAGAVPRTAEQGPGDQVALATAAGGE